MWDSYDTYIYLVVYKVYLLLEELLTNLTQHVGSTNLNRLQWIKNGNTFTYDPVNHTHSCVSEYLLLYHRNHKQLYLGDSWKLYLSDSSYEYLQGLKFVWTFSIQLDHCWSYLITCLWRILSRRGNINKRLIININWYGSFNMNNHPINNTFIWTNLRIILSIALISDSVVERATTVLVTLSLHIAPES